MKKQDLQSLFLFFIAVSVLSACSGFKPSQAPELRLREAHPFGTTRIAFSPSGTRLASGGWMGKVHLWSVPDGERIQVFSDYGKPVRALVWLDDRQLLSASADGKIVVWDSYTGRELSAMQTEPLGAIALLDSPTRIVAGYSSGRLRVFSYPEFNVLEAIEAGSKILSVASTPRREHLAVSMRDKHILFLDSRLQRIRRMDSPGQQVRELRFSPDGRQLAGGGWFRVFLWDTHTGRLEIRDIEHRGAVVSLDYDPSGRELATIGRFTDASLRVTAVDDGKLLRRLAPHSMCGWNVRYSPDGRYLASSGEDGSIHFYNMDMPYQPTWHHN